MKMRKHNIWQKDKRLKKFLECEIAKLNREIKINPNNAVAYLERGLCYGEKGNDNQAIRDFNRAIEIDPDYAEAYNNRAIGYFYKKEYKKTWKNLHKAEALGYDTKFVRGLLGSLKEYRK